MTLIEPDWPTARRTAAAAEPLPRVLIPLDEADGRVLAAPALARTDLPAYDTSAMDGWAVAGAGPWEVVGEVLAGSAPGVELFAGQCCRIATGAALPVGATAVVRTEDASTDNKLVSATVLPGADIRPRGEECVEGSILLPPGATLGPAHIGMLSAAGLDEVEVRQQPRIAIVLFGDELVTHGVAGIGQVRDSLGPQLPGWFGRLGATVVSVTRATDTLAEHVRAIDAAREVADVVVTTGGTATGPVDHLHPAVAELGGHFVIDSVAVRPGHPMTLADLGEEAGNARWLLGLPGNPQSAVVSLLSLGAPLLDSLLGRTDPGLSRVTLTRDTPAPATEHRLVAASLHEGMATPVAHLGSAMLRGLADAHGFVVLPPGGSTAGQQVPWLPLPA